MPVPRLTGWVPTNDLGTLNVNLAAAFKTLDQSTRVQFARVQYGAALDLPAPDTVSLVPETITLPLASTVPGYRVTTQNDVMVVASGTDTIDGHPRVSVAGGAALVSDGVSWIVLGWGGMGRYDVRRFYAVGDYLDRDHIGTDNTVAIQAAITAIEAAGTGGLLTFPEGKFRHGPVRVKQLGLHVLGSGQRATFLIFEPGAPGVAWTFSTNNYASTYGTAEAPTTLGPCSMRHVSMRGYNGATDTHQKTGLQLVCTSEFVLECVDFNDWWTSADNVAEGPSKWVQLMGKELTLLRNVTGAGDRPISCEPNPKERAGGAGPIDCDLLHIENFYGVVTDPTQAAIYVAPDMNFLRCLIDGTCIVANAKYGFYWLDPVGGVNPNNNGSDLTIKNMSSEQGSSAAGATILIQRQGPGKTNYVTLDNIQCDTAMRGIVLQGTIGTRISGGSYGRYTSQTTSPMALTLAASCRQTRVDGFLIPKVAGGTSLVSLTGQTAYPVSSEPLTDFQLNALVVYDP